MNDVLKESSPSEHVRLEQQAIKLIGLGKLEDAERIYKYLIFHGSTSFVVFGNLSAIYLHQGKLSQCELYAKAALEVNSDFPQAYHCLGNVLRKQGKLSEAIEVYGKALNINPNFTQVFYNLGLALKANGQIILAIDAYKRALFLEPKFPQACHNLGIALKQNGQLSEAIFYYKEALRFKPNFPQAYNNLGIALKDNGQLISAIESYKNALIFQPTFYQACNNLGVALKEQGYLSAAIDSYKKALDINPHYVTACNNLGIAYKDIGDLDSAIYFHRRVLDLDPINPNALYRLGRIYRSQGDLQQAKQYLRQALKLNPNHSDSLYILSTDIDNESEVAYLITASESAQSTNLTIREKATVEFCLANCFHWLKNFNKSAHHIVEANKLKLTYMPSNLQIRLEQTAQLRVAADSFQNGSINDGLGRIFIVGVPRCGSTLLETILATNPNIFELGETDALSRAIQRINNIQTENSRVSLAEAYFSLLSQEAKIAHYTVDKNLYNYQRVFHIARGLPAAKIIYCRRNSLDNILSMLRSNLRSGNNFTSDPLDAAKLILNHDQFIKQAIASNPGQIYTFNYDDVAASPEKAIKSLVDWLGLSWSINYLHPERNRRIVNTASAIQVRKPINNKSLNGWKNYRALLRPAQTFFLENSFSII